MWLGSQTHGSGFDTIKDVWHEKIYVSSTNVRLTWHQPSLDNALQRLPILTAWVYMAQTNSKPTWHQPSADNRLSWWITLTVWIYMVQTNAKPTWHQPSVDKTLPRLTTLTVWVYMAPPNLYQISMWGWRAQLLAKGILRLCRFPPVHLATIWCVPIN